MCEKLKLRKDLPNTFTTRKLRELACDIAGGGLPYRVECYLDVICEEFKTLQQVYEYFANSIEQLERSQRYLGIGLPKNKNPAKPTPKTLEFDLVEGLPDSYGYHLFLRDDGEVVRGYYDHKRGWRKPQVFTLYGETLSFCAYDESRIVGYLIKKEF